jgi:transposase InsO family protein
MRETITSAIPRVSIQVSCALAQIPRSSYYRHRHRIVVLDAPAEMDLRDQIQRICLERSSGGYRRVTHALRRLGFTVNHKRVLRLMRLDNLLCVRKKAWVQTTNSKHGFHVYPNVARDLVVTAPNQLWGADITYIRLQHEFVFLAVILDAFSRRAVGWALERFLDTRLTLAALTMALAQRPVGPDLVHHSDRGVQYASHEYVEVLQAYGITISMSRSGSPYDNAMVESFMKTLKH